MGDRKRASTESMTAESKVSNDQYERLEREIARLLLRIEKQDRRIDELEKSIRECEHHRALAEAENLHLKAGQQLNGMARQEAAKIVAADRNEGEIN